MTQEEYPKVYLYRRVVQAKLFIDEHFDEKLDLNLISDEAYFSKYHFLRLFKKIYGKTPYQYLMSVRIAKAQELLKKEIPVSDVCLLVGHESLTSFTGLFKRKTGISPSTFQKQAIQRRADQKKAPLKYVPNCYAEFNGWTEKSNFEELGD